MHRPASQDFNSLLVIRGTGGCGRTAMFNSKLATSTANAATNQNLRLRLVFMILFLQFQGLFDCAVDSVLCFAGMSGDGFLTNPRGMEPVNIEQYHDHEY